MARFKRPRCDSEAAKQRSGAISAAHCAILAGGLPHIDQLGPGLEAAQSSDCALRPCLATQERLRKEQADADAASAEASRVQAAEQLEKARRASWRNYNLNGAIKMGEEAFRRYLDRPTSEIDATDCGPTGWPPGDGPHNYGAQALLPAPVEDDPADVSKTLIGQALVRMGRKKI